MLVQGLRGEQARLLEQEFIEMRQDGGIETYGILDKHYHAYADIADVILVELVFKQFDDRQQEVHVAEPAEHVVDARHVLFLDAARYFL